jgi:Immunity protein Imm5
MIDSIEIDIWTSRMREAVQSDVNHHLDWRLRRAFYLALGDDLQSVHMRGWLAILSAQRVLPIILNATPWEPQALQDLDAAVRFLRGWPYPIHGKPSFTPDQVSEASYDACEEGYNLLTDTDRADVIRAQVAAAKALLEVGQTGKHRFEGIEHYYVTSQGVAFSGTPQPEDNVTGDDEAWSVLIAVGDAAGAAAVASACGPDTSACDPDKLQTYWMWWLTDAVPLASNLSSKIPPRPKLS